MSHEDISSSSEIQVLLLNGIVTDNDGSYSLVGKSRFESCLTVKCRIFLVSPRPCPIRSGWPPSPMTAAKSTPLSLSHALHAHRSRTRRRNRHSFDSPATNQPSELRASEIAARSDSLYTRGIKGPPSLPVAFVNRAGMASWQRGWNYLILPEEGRKRRDWRGDSI